MEYETPPDEQSTQFWSNVLETNRATSYEKLPSRVFIPSPWQAKIQELVEKISGENREFGVVGYLSPDKPEPQNIKFGKIIRGSTESSVDLYFREGKMLVLPYGSPALIIHTHPPIAFKERLPSGLKVFLESWPIPSAQDVAVFLDDRNNLALSFVIFTSGEQFTDIDVLVKCHETRLIASDEGHTRVVTSYKKDIDKLEEWAKTMKINPHLVDWKRFFATMAGAYRAGYYSSYDCSTVTHQELGAGRLILTKVPPFESLEHFFKQSGF